jgi:hypothetical protein
MVNLELFAPAYAERGTPAGFVLNYRLAFLTCAISTALRASGSKTKLNREINMAKCPHCKKPVSLGAKPPTESDALPVRKEVVGNLKKEVMYSCPHCDCVLGFGFFLGGLLTGRPR